MINQRSVTNSDSSPTHVAKYFAEAIAYMHQQSS